MERSVHISNKDLQILCGKYDENFKSIEEELGVKISLDKAGLKIAGKRSDVDKTCELIDYLKSIIDKGSEIKNRDIVYALKLVVPEEGIDFKKLSKGKIDVEVKGGLITPKTKGQIEYIDAIKQYDIVFGIGPAGT